MGNDPVVYYRVRINLSELVGVVYPDGIDETVVHPEAIKDFKENNFSRQRDRRGMPPGFSGYVGHVRRMFESGRESAEKRRRSRAVRH